MAENDTPTLGGQIDAALKRQRLSQNQLAKMTGLSPSYISKLVRDKVANPRTHLAKIEKALGLRAGYFKVSPRRPAADTAAMMERALANQEQYRRDLEALSRAVDEIAETLRRNLVPNFLEELRRLIRDELSAGQPQQQRRRRSH